VKSLYQKVKDGELTKEQAGLVVFGIIFLTKEYWRQVWCGEREYKINKK
jgi:hypothetical protein